MQRSANDQIAKKRQALDKSLEEEEKKEKTKINF